MYSNTPAASFSALRGLATDIGPLARSANLFGTLAVWVAVLACTLWAAPVRGQSQNGAQPQKAVFDLQLFYPVPGAHGFLTTESAEINPHLEISAGLTFNWAHNPLLVAYPDGLSVGSVIENRFDTDLSAAIGLFDWVDLGFVMPIVVQGGASGVIDSLVPGPAPEPFNSTIPGFTAGDLRIIPKVRPLNVSEGLFSLAIIPAVVVPTGGGAIFTSERQPLFAPTLAVSSRLNERFRLALNLGYRWRETGTDLTLVGITIKDEIFVKLGFAANFEPLHNLPIEVVAEFLGHTAADNGFGLASTEEERDQQQARTALEADLGLRIWVLEALALNAGVGTGLTHGIGSPAPRVFLGVTFFTGWIGPPDMDGDDLPDELDKCPERPEDLDDFEDDDGCPEVDNDRDRVLDEDDECPLEPEDKDGHEDHDGCPEPDNDGDGRLDTDDQCPNEAEDVDDFEDEDGCPDIDNDNDGVVDTADGCPNDAEDADEFTDYDGCPDNDNDQDGLTDLNDLCPNHAEDLDGFEDDDGCADDNDGDGLLDGQDACPTDAEIYNGVADGDGCPEPEGPPSLVRVNEDTIELVSAISFVRGGPDLTAEAVPVLDHLAAALTGHPEILRLTVQGHVRTSVDPDADQYLSQIRAETVVTYLEASGVERDRLEAVGLGSSQPLSRKRRHWRNDRIVLLIAERRPLGVDVRELDTGGVELELELGEEPEAKDGGGIFDGDFVVDPDAPEQPEDGGIEFDFDSGDAVDLELDSADDGEVKGDDEIEFQF